MPGDAVQAMLAAWRAGDTAGAQTLAREILERDPAQPQALQLLAASASATGDWATAAAHLARAAAVLPDNSAIQFSHADALRRAGDMAAAIQVLDTLLAHHADHVPALVTLAQLIDRGTRAGEAIVLLDRAVARAPNDPKPLVARGKARLARGNPDGVQDLARACRLAPALAAVHLEHGLALAERGQHEQAEAALRRAVERDPALVAGHVALAKLAMLRRAASDAEARCRAALDHAADHPEALALLAQALRDQRRDGEARQAAERALAAAPAQPLARLVDAQLRRAAGDASDARARLAALVADDPPGVVAIEALTELGHAEDALGAYEAAFAHFTEANRRAEAGSGIVAAEHNRLPRRIDGMHRCLNGPGAAADPPVDRAPVFVVGFPRSGTTLIEHLLASHGGFAVSDEEPIVSRVARSLCLDDPSRLAALTAAQLGAARDDYWAQARACRPEVGTGTPFVDKQPWNLIELPFIARLFPGAKVVAMIRDPRDACLSAFMQYFTLNPGTIHFTRLDRTAALYRRMMGLWQRMAGALPLDMRAVRYEDLVANPGAVLPGVLAFLNAAPGVGGATQPLDQAAGAADRAISTPSRDAVSGRVTQRAVGRWRHYARQLGPVLSELAPFVAAFGYEPGEEAAPPSSQ